MIVSAHSEAGFGFSPRVAPALMASLPPVSAKAPAPTAPTQAVPQSGEAPKAEATNLPPEG